MIFIVFTKNQEENEVLFKQAQDLTRKKYSFIDRKKYNKSLMDNKRGEIITSDDPTRPISRLEPDETLYVVGHGDRDAPVLSDLSPKELSNLLRGCGLDPRVKYLKIKLICCHSGHSPSVIVPSFAQLFYFELARFIHELDWAYRDKEGSLFTVKAPKHVIGFRVSDDKAIGLKPDQYAEYELVKKEHAAQLDDWLNEKTVPLSKTDYQIL